MTDLHKTIERGHLRTISRQQIEIYELRGQRDRLQHMFNVDLEAKRKAVREGAQLKTRLATYRTRLERLEKACEVWRAKAAGKGFGARYKALEKQRDALQQRLNDVFMDSFEKAALGECDNQEPSKDVQEGAGVAVPFTATSGAVGGVALGRHATADQSGSFSISTTDSVRLRRQRNEATKECEELKDALGRGEARCEELEAELEELKATRDIWKDAAGRRLKAGTEALEEWVQWKATAKALETRCKDLETRYNELGAGTLFMGDGDAFIEIMTERKKQRVKWSADHDDGHIRGELAIAAAQLAVDGTDESVTSRSHEEDMWGLVHYTEDDRRRLVIAAALLVAEIGRERRRSERYRKSREALVERTVSSSEIGTFEGDELAAALVEEHVEAHTDKDSETIGVVVDKTGASELSATASVLPAENRAKFLAELWESKKHLIEQGRRDSIEGRPPAVAEAPYIHGYKGVLRKDGMFEYLQSSTGHMPPVKIKKIRPELGESIPMPERKSKYAAGYDVSAAIDGPLTMCGGDAVMIALGFSLEIPLGYEGQIRPRSGLSKKAGITVLNAPGTLDADYRGEVCAMLINHREPDCRFTIEPGDRIAQIVFAAVETPELVVVDELSETERGDGGFGSTDKEP